MPQVGEHNPSCTPARPSVIDHYSLARGRLAIQMAIDVFSRARAQPSNALSASAVVATHLEVFRDEVGPHVLLLCVSFFASLMNTYVWMSPCLLHSDGQCSLASDRCSDIGAKQQFKACSKHAPPAPLTPGPSAPSPPCWSCPSRSLSATPRPPAAPRFEPAVLVAPLLFLLLPSCAIAAAISHAVCDVLQAAAGEHRRHHVLRPQRRDLHRCRALCPPDCNRDTCNHAPRYLRSSPCNAGLRHDWYASVGQSRDAAVVSSSGLFIAACKAVLCDDDPAASASVNRYSSVPALMAQLRHGSRPVPGGPNASRQGGPRRDGRG
jgi:hypothetical protein